MNRTSRKEVETLFDRFVYAMGGRIATRCDDINGWVLEYHRYPNGYRLYQAGEHCSESDCVFGATVRNARDMADTLRFAMAAIRQAEKNRDDRERRDLLTHTADTARATIRDILRQAEGY